MSSETAPGIMAAADLLLMEKVKGAVCEFLQKLICSENCVYLARLADTYVCPALLESAQRFIQRNFEDVCRTEDFMELTFLEVEELISLDNIYVTSEETIVESVLAWCDKSEDRAEYLTRLFKHVKLNNLSSDCLRRLQDNSVIKSDSECLENIIKQRDLNPEPGSSRARGLNKFIVAVGFDSCNVEYLDLDRPEEGWNVLTQIPEMRYGLSGAGLASYGDTLLVTGGVGRAGVLKALNRFVTFNVRTNEWSEGPSMITARKCHASAVLDGKLYVMGGSDSQLSVLTAECLDLTQPEDQWAWHSLSPLPTWHNGSFSSVIGSRLYLPVAYGSDNDKLYDTSRDLWLGWEGSGEGEDGNRISRDRPGVGQLGDKIYLIGGAGMRELMDTVECWDGSVWRRTCSLTLPREGPGVVNHDGKLYAIGGRGGDGTVEIYDPTLDKWEVLGERLSSQDQEYSAVILDRVV